jgi:hypothetical protein
VTDAQDADVVDFVHGLDRHDLERRLLALAARDEVAQTALRAEAAAAAGTFDLAAFRKELTARLRVSGFLDRRQPGKSLCAARGQRPRRARAAARRRTNCRSSHGR